MNREFLLIKKKRKQLYKAAIFDFKNQAIVLDLGKDKLALAKKPERCMVIIQRNDSLLLVKNCKLKKLIDKTMKDARKVAKEVDNVTFMYTLDEKDYYRVRTGVELAVNDNNELTHKIESSLIYLLALAEEIRSKLQLVVK